MVRDYIGIGQIGLFWGLWYFIGLWKRKLICLMCYLICKIDKWGVFKVFGYWEKRSLFK